MCNPVNNALRCETWERAMIYIQIDILGPTGPFNSLGVLAFVGLCAFFTGIFLRLEMKKTFIAALVVDALVIEYVTLMDHGVTEFDEFGITFFLLVEYLMFASVPGVLLGRMLGSSRFYEATAEYILIAAICDLVFFAVYTGGYSMPNMFISQTVIAVLISMILYAWKGPTATGLFRPSFWRSLR